jgi:hypothetical protein
VRSILLLCLLLAPAAHAQPTAPRVRIVEDLRLDATAEDFPAVGRIYVGPHGQIAVPIQADMQLRVYDASGKRLANVGRRGAGPGEFMGINAVGWLHDTMWVGDLRQRRTVFVGPDYTVLRTQARQPRQGADGSVAFMDPILFLPGGGALLQGMQLSPGRRGVLIHRDASGTEREILALPSSDSSPRMIWVNGFGFGVPFSLQPQFSFAPNGQSFVELSADIPARQDATFHVRLFSITGDTVFGRAYPFRGIPIPRRVADSAIATLRPSPGHAVNEAPDMAKRVQDIARDRISRWYIPAETITSGLDHTIWIGMRPTEEGRGYLILNGRSDPIGSLLVPVSTRVRQASATHIWVTETDDDGLSSVVRYRVLGLTCGAGGC